MILWFLLGLDFIILKFLLSNVLEINFEIPQIFYRLCPNLMNTITSVRNTVISAHSSQQYSAIVSKKCYASRLWMTVTGMDGQGNCNFHGMVQCYGHMLHITIMLRNNFLHRVTSSQTVLLIRCNLWRCYFTLLFYMCVPTFKPTAQRRLCVALYTICGAGSISEKTYTRWCCSQHFTKVIMED